MDAFFARHPEWASHHAPRPDLLPTYAAQVGLDTARLATSAASEAVAQRIRQDVSDGRAFGANRTPTIFVNGVPLTRLGYDPLRAAVAAALEP
jgi:protein-disulfide isomerase